MPEMLGALFVLAVILGIVTVVGHCFWVAGRAILRTFSGDSPRHEPRGKPCVYCGRPLDADAWHCYWCGRNLRDADAGHLADLDTTRRTLTRLVDKHQLGRLLAQQVIDQIDAIDPRNRPVPAPETIPTPEPKLSPAPAAVPKPVEPVETPILAAIVETPAEPLPKNPPPAPVVREVAAPPALAASKTAPETRVVPMPVEVAPVPAEPRKSLAEMLAEFMAPHNIRWGELIGGLLFLVGAAALVITQWQTLERFRYLRFATFLGATSAVFGFGLYAQFRWRLQATSRGMLVLAGLLVPLNFLAMAGLASNEPLAAALTYEVVSLAVFGGLLMAAGSVLVPRGRRWLVLATLGTSLVVLAVGRRYHAPEALWHMASLGAIAPVILLVAIVGYLRVLARRGNMTVSRASGLFTLLGLGLFGLSVASGLLTVRSVDALGWRPALHGVAPAAALTAVAILLGGTAAWQRCRASTALEPYRTAGLWIALVASMVMLAGMGLAWPRPDLLVLVGLAEAAALVVAARHFNLPPLHGPAIAIVGTVYLVLFAWLRLHFPQPAEVEGRLLLHTMLGGEAGTSLLGLLALLGGAGVWLHRRKDTVDAWYYLGGAGIAGLLSMTIVTIAAVGQHSLAAHATAVYATFGIAALAGNLLARRPAISYAGLALLAAATGWGLWGHEGQLNSVWATGFGSLAAVVSLGAMLVRLATRQSTPSQAASTGKWLARAEWLRIYFVPMLHVGEVLAFAAFTLSATLSVARPDYVGQTYLWIGAATASLAWLLLTICAGGVRHLSMHQAAACVAAVLAVAWHQGSWPKLDQLHAETIQRYGLALAALVLAWTAAWAALRRWKRVRQLNRLLSASGDRYLLAALTIGLSVTVAFGLFSDGLSRFIHQSHASTAFGQPAWAMLVVLAACVVVSIWHRVTLLELCCGTALVCLPACLIAGHCVEDVSVARALRWGLALTLTTGSVVVWARTGIAAKLRAWGGRLKVNPHDHTAVVALLFLLTIPVVLGLAIAATLLADPIGDQDGWRVLLANSIQMAGPLALVVVTLVGYAWRQRAAGFLLAAGAVFELAVALVYLLVLNQSRVPFELPRFLELLQLLAIAAGGWALAWMMVADRRIVAPEDSRKSLAWQIGQAALAAGLMFYIGLATLALSHRFGREAVAVTGGPLGWLAVATAFAAAGRYSFGNTGRLSPHFVGSLGAALIALAACSVDRYSIVGSYRTWMLGWAGYALAMAVAAFWLTRLGQPNRKLIRAAADWVSWSGLAASLLAIKTASVDGDHLWAAGAVATASLAAAVVAYTLRRNAWAFVAALGGNIACTLVALHYAPAFITWPYLVRLALYNIAASSASAIVWLGLRRLVVQRDAELVVTTGPWLRWQVSAPAAAMAALLLGYGVLVGLITPVAWSLAGHLARELGGTAGWTAIVLSASALVWALFDYAPRRLGGAVAGLAIAATVLASASVARGGAVHADVRALEVLLAGLPTIAAAVLGLLISSELRATWSQRLRAWVDGNELTAWINALGAVTVALSVRAFVADATPVAWSVAPIAATGLVSAVLAFARRSVWQDIAAGLAFNLAASMAWGDTHGWTIGGMIVVNALALSASSIAWSLARMALAGRLAAEPSGVWRQCSAAIAVGLLTALAAAEAFAVLAPDGYGLLAHLHVAGWQWAALTAAAVAAVLLLWDRTARFLAEHFYGLLFTASIGCVLPWSEPVLRRPALVGLALAGTVLVAGIIGRALALAPIVSIVLHIPARPARRDNVLPTGGLLHTGQVLLATIAGALALWISLDHRFLTPWSAEAISVTWFGTFISAALVLGSIGTAGWRTAAQRAAWQQAAFVFGLLTLCAAGWTQVAPSLTLPWMHRAVVVHVAATLLAALAAILGRRLLPSSSDWVAASVSALRWFMAVSATSLGMVFLAECLGFKSHGGTPMAPWAIAVVAIDLLLATGMMLRWAMSPGADPFGLSVRGRTVYVYMAEALLVLVGIHLRLTVPELFTHHIIRRYGLFLAMGLAFAWAALAEWCQRRGVKVLAEPLANTALALPLAPMAGFWLLPHASPVVWGLMALFYGLMAAMRRSLPLGILAVLTGNVGLWVLWHRWQLDLLVHPQLWLIPPALAALVAEYFGRNRLKPAQATALRYVGLATVYLSSTADMFIAGIGHSLTLPLVLLGLSVAGVLLGMALRVRSFVYLGTTFLLVVVASLVKYLTFDLHQTWILWVCLIVAGGSLIALFALFEKRRNDIQAALARFRGWQQ